MILIRFPNPEAKRAALGRLAGRLNFKSYASGEMLVPEDALAFLAVEGIGFTVQGPANEEQIEPAPERSARRHSLLDVAPVSLGQVLCDRTGEEDLLEEMLAGRP